MRKTRWFLWFLLLGHSQKPHLMVCGTLHWGDWSHLCCTSALSIPWREGVLWAWGKAIPPLCLLAAPKLQLRGFLGSIVPWQSRASGILCGEKHKEKSCWSTRLIWYPQMLSVSKGFAFKWTLEVVLLCCFIDHLLQLNIPWPLHFSSLTTAMVIKISF